MRNLGVEERRIRASVSPSIMCLSGYHEKLKKMRQKTFLLHQVYAHPALAKRVLVKRNVKVHGVYIKHTRYLPL